MARGTCWQGYEQKGFKKKGNKSVPNCVKVGTMKGDMIKKPVKAFKGLAVEIFEKTDKGKSFPLGVMGAANVFKRSQTARDIGSQLGLAPKALSDYYQKKEDDKQKSTGQVVAKAYTGKFIDVELDGQKYSNTSKKNYYKGML